MEDVTTQQISQTKILGLYITPVMKIFFYLIPLFFVPFLLGGPQLLVGSIVNLLLIFVALNYKNYAAIIPMVMLPSIATSVRGLVFGPFTIFLVYMMPAIWVGNLILVYTIQHIKTQWLGILLGGIAKTIFLFFVAYLLIHFGVLPAIFLKAMGIFQFITVMIAGVVFVSFTKLSNHNE